MDPSGEEIPTPAETPEADAAPRRRPSLLTVLVATGVSVTVMVMVATIVMNPPRPRPPHKVAEEFVRGLSLGLERSEGDAGDAPIGFHQAWELLSERAQGECSAVMFLQDFETVFGREGRVMDSQCERGRRRDREGRVVIRFVLYLGHERQRREDMGVWRLDLSLVQDDAGWVVDAYELNPATENEVH